LKPPPTTRSRIARPVRRSIALILPSLVVAALVAATGPITRSHAVSGTPAGHGGALAAPDWSAAHVPNQLLVKLAPETGASAGASASVAAAGAEILDTIPQLGLAVVETAPDADLAVAAAELTASPDVEWVEPNYIFSLDAVPNDPYYAAYQSGYLGRMQMPAAWDYTTGRPEVIIAVLDTGVDMSHPDLSAGIWTNPDEAPDNGIDDDHNGFIDDVHGWDFAADDNLPDDDYGHGTHVAGIAAARINNSIGIAGMAGRAMIMPVDVFNVRIGTYDSLIRAIVYATDNGARVINMSLGATSYSRGEQAAVDYAWSHGVVSVASAGNTGGAGVSTYHYPAAQPHVIAVAATDASDQRASFSTYGDFVDVAAPGFSVWSTYPGSSYTSMSGTSMAAPHVSGLAALLLSLNPDLTPDLASDLIEQNADDLGAPGWDSYFGHGRINALRALAEVTPNLCPTPSPTPGPPLEIWPPGCQELIPDGDFEAELGEWQTSGSVCVDNTQAYLGTYAAHFPGGPDSHGVLTHTLDLPLSSGPLSGPFPQAGSLDFAFRIENQDSGWGSTPPRPYDDWLTAEVRTDDGRLLGSFLRTGNSADAAGDGLPWDQFLYRLGREDFAALGAADSANLVFKAGNDSDQLPTDFWVDAVRFCVSIADNPSWPDLVVLQLEETGESCGSSAAGGVEFVVANQGLAEAANFYVRASTPGAYTEWHVASLPAGESQVFTWWGMPGIYTYTVTADGQNVVFENDETNNQLSKRFRTGFFLPLVIR
jgi:thermitase